MQTRDLAGQPEDDQDVEQGRADGRNDGGGPCFSHGRRHSRSE